MNNIQNYGSVNVNANYGYANKNLNFKSKQAMTEKVQELGTRIVRNKRTYYKDGEKPLWKDLFDKYTKGFTKRKWKIYFGFGEITRPCTKTVYYDAKGKDMATVYNIRGEGRRIILSTPDKDYCDIGKTGIVDFYDEDKIVEIGELFKIRL